MFPEYPSSIFSTFLLTGGDKLDHYSTGFCGPYGSRIIYSLSFALSKYAVLNAV